MKGLLIIDIQNDYFEGGANPLTGSEEAGFHAGEILKYFRKEKLPIIHIRHISKKKGSTFFLEGTKGSEIRDIVAPAPGEVYLVKHSPDSFLGTGLQEELRKRDITELVICGMMTHMCVDSTARSANGLGYKIELIEDACATKDLKWNNSLVPASQVQNAFLSALNSSFAEALDSKSWLKRQS